MSENKLCEECGEIILGRSDKKFCSDQCRNTFNNRLNSDSSSIIRNISNILRKNRRILQELSPNGKARVHKDRLAEKGFNFIYNTHQYKTQKGDTYIFCFEYGYLPIADNYYIIVLDQKMADKN